MYRLILLALLLLVGVASAQEDRGPIQLDGDLSVVTSNAIRSGLGQANNPYIISDWAISGTTAKAFPDDNACAICIQNTNLHIRVEDNVVKAFQDQDWLYGFLIENAPNVVITGNVLQHAQVGLLVDNPGDSGDVYTNTIRGNDCGAQLYGRMDVWNNYFDNTANLCGGRDARLYQEPVPGQNIMGGPFMGGNYWSDHEGIDSTGDRLANNRYHRVFQSALEDQHPLLENPKRDPQVAIEITDQDQFFPPFNITFGAQVESDTAIDEYEWVFGDGTGTVTAEPTASHEYDGSGPYYAYVVARDVSGDTGHSNSLEIRASQPEDPIARIVPDETPEIGTCYEAGYPVTCIKYVPHPTTGYRNFDADLLFGYVDPTGEQRAFVFVDYGDGSPTEIRSLPDDHVGNPTCFRHNFQQCLDIGHEYTRIGTFTVKVEAVSFSGYRVATQLDVTVEPAYPVIEDVIVLYDSGEQNAHGRRLGAPDAAEAVHLMAIAHDPDGLITEYEWLNLDANQQHEGKRITFLEPEGWTKGFTLTVTDNDGLQATRSIPGHDLAPTSAIPPLWGVSLEHVSGSAIDAPWRFQADASLGNIAQYLWDFGDGVTARTSNNVVDHVYRTPGNFDVSVIAINDDAEDSIGRQDTLSVSVPGGGNGHRLENPALAALNTDQIPEGEAPLEVHFQGVHQYGGTNPAPELLIDHGDGSIMPGHQSTYTYHQPGIYTAKFWVVDNHGRSSLAEKKVIVNGPIGMQTSVSADRITGAAPLRVTFTADSSNTYGQTLNYEWVFGDGDQAISGDYPGPYKDRRQHTFMVPGTYQVNVSAYGELGSSSATINITVDSSGAPYALSIKAQPLRHSPPLIGNLEAVVTPLVCAPNNFTWIHDDKVLGYGRYLDVNFSEPGKHIVEVHSTGGCPRNKAQVTLDARHGTHIQTNQSWNRRMADVQFWFAPDAGRYYDIEWYADGKLIGVGTQFNHAFEEARHTLIEVYAIDSFTGSILYDREVLSTTKNNAWDIPSPSGILAVMIALALRRRR